MPFAMDVQYSRALRTLQDAPIADLKSPAVLSALRSLHPTPVQPIQPLSPADLPPAPQPSEFQMLRAAKSLNPKFAAGPDLMSPRPLRLLVTTSIGPQEGVTSLSALTSFVCRLTLGDLSQSVLPLFVAATLLLIQQRPDKIRHIAIDQAPRRLMFKAVLPAALQDSADFLAREQLANGVRAGMDATVHDVQMLAKRYGRRNDNVSVSIEANNVFYICSRQQLLNALPTRATSLALLIHMICGHLAPPLLVPSCTHHRLSSREDTREGDPASMLLFSLTTQPLLQKITRLCNLKLIRWYADDGTRVGPVNAASHVLRILTAEARTSTLLLAQQRREPTGRRFHLPRSSNSYKCYFFLLSLTAALISSRPNWF